MLTIIYGIVGFTVVILALVAILMVARSQLVATGDVTIGINGDPENALTASAGSTLLNTLADNNLFIPSGGGQWAVQGPIMMGAAQELGADLPRVAMSVALGDQWTNLIQPLAIMPVLAIAGISVRKIMGFTFFALLWSGVVFAVALLLCGSLSGKRKEVTSTTSGPRARKSRAAARAVSW